MVSQCGMWQGINFIYDLVCNISTAQLSIVLLKGDPETHVSWARIWPISVSTSGLVWDHNRPSEHGGKLVKFLYEE